MRMLNFQKKVEELSSFSFFPFQTKGSNSRRRYTANREKQCGRIDKRQSKQNAVKSAQNAAVSRHNFAEFNLNWRLIKEKLQPPNTLIRDASGEIKADAGSNFILLIMPQNLLVNKTQPVNSVKYNLPIRLRQSLHCFMRAHQRTQFMLSKRFADKISAAVTEPCAGKRHQQVKHCTHRLPVIVAHRLP